MANTLKFKRGLLAGLPTAAEGEPLFTTDTADLYIGTSTGNQRFQKYIASGATTQILRGDGSLYTFPLNISSPSNGQVLKYNGTAWVNDSDAGITGSGSSGQVAYFTGATTQAGNVNLFWDATNLRLGIKNSNPTYTLSLNGGISLTNDSGIGILWQNGAAFRSSGTIYLDYGQAGSGDLQFRGGSSLINTAIFYNNNNVNLAASGSGSVGISQPSPVTKLDVNGAMAVGGVLGAHQTDRAILEYNANKVALRAYGNTSGTGFIAFNTGGGGGTADSEKMRLTPAGRLLLGTTTETTQTLIVAGNVKFDADAATNGFYWDNTNKRLSIGRNTAAYPIDVIGSGIRTAPTPGSTGLWGSFVLGSSLDSLSQYFDAFRITGTGAGGYASNSTNVVFQVWNGSAWNTQMTINQGTGAVGIGTTGLTNYALRVSKNIVGGATSYGVAMDSTIQSTVGTSATAFFSNVATQAASFTLTEINNFYAVQGTFGAGSTVTNQYGFRAHSGLTGATNNYGFFGEIPSGTNRWNLYMPGTASNHIQGSLAIGTTTFNDNVNPYKAVVFYATSGSGGGGLMVTSNQAANAANAMVSAVQWGLNNGSVSKPSGLFFNYSNTTHGNRAIDTVGNLISKTLVGAANLSITNNNGYIQHVDLNSTSNDYVNYQGYLYVQRNSGTVNVNSYTSFRSMYQTAVANETITEVIDFRAAQPTLSTGALVTNRYGLLIDFNNTQVTNAWGIYQSSSTVKNHINGNLVLGSTSDTGEKLQVNGTFRVNSSSRFGATDTTYLHDFYGGSGSSAGLRFYNLATLNGTIRTRGDISTYQINTTTFDLALQCADTKKVTIGKDGNANLLVVDATNERVGINNATPTAVLDLPASTTTRSTLRIRSGTAPTTPNDGDIWFDGTDIKMRIGGVTKTFTLI